jgi:hypothetical protein
MFEKAATLQDDGLEPCHRVGGCPHKSRVPKDGVVWFCIYCMDDLSKGNGEI